MTDNVASPYELGRLVRPDGYASAAFGRWLFDLWRRTGEAGGAVIFNILSGTTYTNLFEDTQGNTYLTNNARYNQTEGYWERIDETRSSWMINLLGVSEPLEEALGLPAQTAGFWIAQPSIVGGVVNPAFTAETPTRKIKDGFTGAAGGWERGVSVTQFGDFVVRGYGIEMDGNGNVPFGRVQAGFASTINGADYRITGVKYNAYLDDSGDDRAVIGNALAGIRASDTTTQPLDFAVVFADPEDSGAGADEVGTVGPTWDEIALTVSRVTGSVNYLDLSPAVTGDPAKIEAKGGDTNIDLKLAPKGTGGVLAKGGGTGMTVKIEDGTTTAGNVGVKAIGNSAYLRAGNNDVLEVDSAYNVRLGVPQALATTATDGFVYVPSCAGAPTGVPTAKTGMIPLVYDSTNNRLYAYNGGWLSSAFA